jgi:hypothetical protein
MPHLYLPTDHTDADLVLAADVAAAVTWTLEAGSGVPEVEAVVRDELPAEPVVNPFAGLAVALIQGIAAIWRSLTAPPAQSLPAAPVAGAAREPQL